MPILSIYVSDETLEQLSSYAASSGRSVDDLAEAAVAEAALMSSRACFYVEGTLDAELPAVPGTLEVMRDDEAAGGRRE